LRHGARDGASFILGPLDRSKQGQCIDTLVQQWADRNDVSAELLESSAFNNVMPNEYVYIRTQMQEATGTVVMYQYKFIPSAGQMQVITSLENSTDLNSVAGFPGARFSEASYQQ
jgi:hypothetical protein